MKNIFWFLVFFYGFFTTWQAPVQAFEVPTKNYKYCNSYEFKFALIKIYDVYLCNNIEQELQLKTLYSKDFSLIINYNQNIKSKNLVSTSIDEIKKNYQISDQQIKVYNAKLNEIFPSVKTSDVIVAKYFADSKKTQFYHNNKSTGEIVEGDFSQKFLDIWLGKNASYPKMREQLLRGTND